MEDLNKTYDEDKMTWNDHDRNYLAETVDTIYHKIAEVLVAQNERFFQEQERHDRRLCSSEKRIEDHEKRLRQLENRALKKRAALFGLVALALILLSFIIF